MARAAAPTSVGRLTTRPVSPSSTASPAPPEAPATWGTPAAAASRKTMPKPSCSRPSHRLRHSMAKTSAAPTKRGEVGVGDRAQQADRGTVLGDPAGQAVGVAAPAGDGHGQIGQSALSRTAASMSTSMPLRGTSRLTLTTSGPSGGRPRSARADLRSSAESGRNRSRSTPGGISTTGGTRCPRRRARRASAAG